MPLFRHRFWLFVFLLGPALAFLPPRGRAADAPAGRKYALLVGVRTYNKDSCATSTTPKTTWTAWPRCCAAPATSASSS